MDGVRFDALVRELLGDGSRRGLLRRLSALPLAGGLASLLEEESIAKKRRAKRRRDHGAASERKRHKRHKRHKRKCKSKAKVCAGKCGIVRYTCHKKKRTANCGPCACDPPCGECLTCDAENGVCIPDPTQTGDDCGETGQICQPDGQCRCDATSCPACATCQGTGVCTSPCGGAGCCAQGTCEDGDTPEACGAGGQTCQECGGDTPFCEDGGCVGCSGANPCPGGQVCCGGSCLAGACCNDEQCGNATPLCLNNTCTGCTSAAQCQSAGLGDLCCGGSCVSGVCCDVTDCEPGGNACVGNQCQCGGGALCDVPTPDCCDPGTCTNVETDPNNCGVCGIACPLDLPVCVNGSCSPCSASNPCPSGQVCCGGVCPAGNCCDNGDCSGETPFCLDRICTGCSSNNQCQTAGLGDLCCGGVCVSGICCADTDCEPEGNTCIGNQCQCGSGAICGDPTPDCCGAPGTCTNTQTDPDHCGFCVNPCSGDTPVCVNGVCSPCSGANPCPGDQICCSGSCFSGICCTGDECGSTGNNCVNNQCQCGDGATCSGDTPTCCGSPGSCTNTQTDPNNCGECGNVCTGTTHTCSNGVCICDICASGCQFSTVQEAVNTVGNAGTATFRICPGTYTRGVGGFPVVEIGNLNLTLVGSGSSSDGTIFDGGQEQTGIPILSVGQGGNVSLQGISITGAQGSQAAIAIFDSTLTLTDVTVVNNILSFNGTIWNDGGTLVLNTGAIVTGNDMAATFAGVGGGGIMNQGSLTLNAGSQVNENAAALASGGGIYNTGTVTLNAGSQVTNNTADFDGGGIYNDGGTVIINDGAVLSGNEAPPNFPNECADVNGGQGCPD